MAADLPIATAILYGLLLTSGLVIGNPSISWNPTSCKDIPKAEIDYSKLNGVWHVQRYTLPGGIKTQCETTNFTLSPDGQNGTINSTFKISNEIMGTIEELSLSATLLAAEGDESFRYSIDNFPPEFMSYVKILSFHENDSYTACMYIPQDDETEVLLIATKEKNADQKKMDDLANEAVKMGLSDVDLYGVEHENCP